MTKTPTILVIGKNGQVGWELCRTVGTLGNVVAVDYPEIDFSDPVTLRDLIRSVKPSIVLNAAAYTAVDKAEEEADLAMAVNGVAPGVIAEEAKAVGAALIHYSTDYVFDGTKQEPYTELDEPSPLSVYGKTKLAGDQAILSVDVPSMIFRTSWVYGWRGKNFLLTMLKLAREREELKMVDDQIGAPTWARAIAEATAQVLSQGVRGGNDFFQDRSGLYNMTSRGKTSWYGFAKEILTADPGRDEHILRRLVAISTEEYKTLAQRPKMSLLDGASLSDVFGVTLPEWQWPLGLWSQS